MVDTLWTKTFVMTSLYIEGEWKTENRNHASCLKLELFFVSRRIALWPGWTFASVRMLRIGLVFKSLCETTKLCG